MSYIKIELAHDDHVALRALGKALEEMALAHGAEPRKTTVGEMTYKLNIDTSEATAALERLNNMVTEHPKVEVDTTAQQVESLAVPGATHVITEQVEVGDPLPVDGGLSQGYTAKIEEIPNPIDSTGTPWDERIHSASKALNSDGTWRLRRKPKDMDEAEWAALVESIKTEIKFDTRQLGASEEHIVVASPEQMMELQDALGASIQATHTAIAEKGDRNEPPVTPPGDDFHTDTAVVTEQTVAGIPPIPVPPPVVVPSVPVSDEQWDFPKLMKFLTERHGKIDVPTVNQLLAVDGLAALTDLNAHPDKIGPFVARVKAHLGE